MKYNDTLAFKNREFEDLKKIMINEEIKFKEDLILKNRECEDLKKIKINDENKFNEVLTSKNKELDELKQLKANEELKLHKIIDTNIQKDMETQKSYEAKLFNFETKISQLQKEIDINKSSHEEKTILKDKKYEEEKNDLIARYEEKITLKEKKK